MENEPKGEVVYEADFTEEMHNILCAVAWLVNQLKYGAVTEIVIRRKDEKDLEQTPLD
jgi:ribose 1,5-bisphosphokinase PhnN